GCFRGASRAGCRLVFDLCVPVRIGIQESAGSAPREHLASTGGGNRLLVGRTGPGIGSLRGSGSRVHRSADGALAPCSGAGSVFQHGSWHSQSGIADVQVGRPGEDTLPMSQARTAHAGAPGAPPYFSISVRKLAVLFFCTGGGYIL